MAKRLSDSEARKIMMKAGAEPIVAFPGTSKPWLCKCLKCRKEISPTLGNVKNQGTKACVYCAKKKVHPDDAIKVMQKAGLEPLEPYPGSNSKWKCKHLKCGEVVYPMYGWIVSGQGGCQKCGYLETKRKQLLPEKDAVAFFNSRGFIPLVPYPGSNRPWKSKCKKCGEITSPYYNRVQSRTGCGVCAERIVVTSRAIQIMKDADLEPLEPYPGGKKPWKSKCKGCKKIVSPKYSDIRNGDGGCKYCGGRYVEPETAFNLMVFRGVTPQEPYVHNAKKWHCVCNTCKRSVYPTWNAVQSGNNPCGYCARRLVDPVEAFEAMKKSGAIPQVKYPGARARWHCICVKCERDIYPDYSSVVNQKQSACAYCAGKKVDAKSAFALMIAADLTPLEDYESAKKPWKCVCNKCNKIVTPTYTSIRIGQGGCRYCTNKGLDYNEPAYLYLMTNENFSAHKVGVANHKTRVNRVSEHQKNGWKIYELIDCLDGDSAYQLEQRVLIWLREERKLPIFLNKHQMPQGGYTETVDASEIGLVTIWNKVLEFSKVKL